MDAYMGYTLLQFPGKGNIKCQCLLLVATAWGFGDQNRKKMLEHFFSSLVFPSLMLTHNGPVTYCMVAWIWVNIGWWHQAITWTNVDLSSVKSSDIHPKAIALKIHQSSVIKINFKIQKYHSSLPGASEFLNNKGCTQLHHWWKQGPFSELI